MTGHHRLHSMLVQWVHSKENLEVAERDLKLLHSALLCSIRNRMGKEYVASQKEVWDEYDLFLKWDGNFSDGRD